MHIHPPKPLHGWREFLGEVGIIVIGVLIALAAEQAVEAWRWRSEVSEAREALKAELDNDLGRARRFSTQLPCIDRRLGDLEAWSRARHAGRLLRLTGPIGTPVGYAMSASVWDIVKTGQTAAHMSLQQKLDYTRTYDGLRGIEELEDRAGDRWRELRELTGARTLSDNQLGRLDADIELVRTLGHFITSGIKGLAPFAQRLGLKPDAQDVVSPEALRQLCTSILPPDAGAQAGPPDQS